MFWQKHLREHPEYRIGAREMLPQLLALGDAVEALGVIGSARDTAPLHALLSDKTSDVRYAAIEAIARPAEQERRGRVRQHEDRREQAEV